MGFVTKQVSGDQVLDWGLQNEGPTSDSSKPTCTRRQQTPAHHSPQKCPRCDSMNTKFCYYNNYNKSQPRHFCKSCKRHWTQGGTLRSVPVGGGRRNKRQKLSNTAATPAPASPRQGCLRGRSTCESPLIKDCPKPVLSKNTGDQKSTCDNTLYHVLTHTSSSSSLLHETTDVDSGNTARKPFGASKPDSVTDVVRTSIPWKPFNVPGLNLEDPNIEFNLSGLTTFEANDSLIPSSYQCLNVYDHYEVNLDSMDESNITTVTNPSTSSVPWPCPNTGNALDLPSYWNWSEMDALTSADLSTAWDYGNAEIKPKTT